MTFGDAIILTLMLVFLTAAWVFIGFPIWFVRELRKRRKGDQ